MKKIIFSWLLSIVFLSATTAQRGEERTGYDGDFFSLEGAIDLFKNSNTIRDFERRLNEEDTYVNNLDLDRDGQIDFIRVEHIRQGNFHAIVLQVPLNRYDVQDIAVIEIEKTGRRRAMLQIVGDEDIYGEEVIVEPYDRYGYSGGRGGPNADYDFRRGYVNVYWWSPVRHIFGRHYRIYRSPYYWSYYPSYWRPWRPCGWNIFRPRVVIYHHHYHHVRFHRLIHVHNFYRPYRHYSHHIVFRSNEIRVGQGRPAIQRERINHGPNRKEFRPGLKKVNKVRVKSTAQVNTKGDRIKTTPRTSTKQYGKDRSNTNTIRTPKSSTGRDRTRTNTTSTSKSDRIKSDRTRITRTPKANSGGRVKQSTSTKPSRSNSKVRSEKSTRPSRSSSTRSTKPSRKSSSVTRSSTRSSSPKSARSSSSKSRSSSKASQSKSRSSSKASRPSRSSKSSKSRSSSKKRGRG